MICSGAYKDRPAVIVQTGRLTATFLPEDGAKLASLKTAEGQELLAVKAEPVYKRLAYDGSYVDSECSGFDDMFPTVDPEQIKGVAYPDHGECCRLPYEVKQEAGAVCFMAASRILPVTYEKTVRPLASGGIAVDYRIENRSDDPLPFLWAGHIMLAGWEGMQVLTPFPQDTPRQIMFDDPGVADPYSLPQDRLMGHCPGKGEAYKFYYLAPLPQGWFGVEYADKRRLMFFFDREKLPYLGLWLNNGTFQDGYSITPEPCTVPFDATGRAAQQGYSSQIPPREAFCFTMEIQLQGGTQ